MSNRLTQRELRAINEALGFRLADEIEDVEDLNISDEDYASAKEKIANRIRWKDDE